jgi:hypothetical protein
MAGYTSIAEVMVLFSHGERKITHGKFFLNRPFRDKMVPGGY